MAIRARDLELDTLTVEQEDRVLTVRFFDPPYNYMTARMQKDLDALTAAVDADVSVGAVVLTGGVPKRYITHFDIAEILAAAQRVGRPLSDQALLNPMRGVNAVGAVPGGERALECSALQSGRAARHAIARSLHRCDRGALWRWGIGDVGLLRRPFGCR
jgi:enoyl-CoA hydratase/carnithine racemase